MPLRVERASCRSSAFARSSCGPALQQRVRGSAALDGVEQMPHRRRDRGALAPAARDGRFGAAPRAQHRAITAISRSSMASARASEAPSAVLTDDDVVRRRQAHASGGSCSRRSARAAGWRQCRARQRDERRAAGGAGPSRWQRRGPDTSLLDSVPERVGDDAQLRRVVLQPLAGRRRDAFVPRRVTFCERSRSRAPRRRAADDVAHRRRRPGTGAHRGAATSAFSRPAMRVAVALSVVKMYARSSLRPRRSHDARIRRHRARSGSRRSDRPSQRQLQRAGGARHRSAVGPAGSRS